MKKIINISGMSCGHCVAHVERALKGLPSLEKVTVDLKKKQAEISGSTLDDGAITAAITDAGYQVDSIQNVS